MTLPQILRNSLAALAVISAFSTLSISNAHAYVCKNSPSQAVGNHAVKAQASQKSRANWTNSVKDQFGLSWSVWSIAATKTVNCNKSGAKWICLASAKPCNYVVP
jgi:hypothetical protein